MNKIINYLYLITLLLTFASCTSCNGGENPIKPNPDDNTPKDVITYVTTADKTMLFSTVSKSFGTGINLNIEKTLSLKPNQTFQTIDGFGVAITGSELVGPVKLEYMLNNLLHYLRLEGYDMEQILEYHLMDI